MAFGQFGTETTSVPTRDEVINWRRSELQIKPAEKGHGLAQGWSISEHHKLNPTDPTTLHKGDGSVVRNNTSVITTVAGNGETVNHSPLQRAHGRQATPTIARVI